MSMGWFLGGKELDDWIEQERERLAERDRISRAESAEIDRYTGRMEQEYIDGLLREQSNPCQGV